MKKLILAAAILIAGCATYDNFRESRELIESGHEAEGLAQLEKLVQENPLIVRNAHQRLYDMVLSHGVEEIEIDKEKVPRYRFFGDVIEDGKDGVFGLERSLHNLMAMFKAAAHGFVRPVVGCGSPLSSARG